MDLRTIGNSELKVSPIGLGCMGLSHACGTPMDKMSAIKVLH